MGSVFGSALCCAAAGVVLLAVVGGAWAVWRRRPRPRPPPPQLTSEDVIRAELAYTLAVMIKRAEPIALPALDAAEAAVAARVEEPLKAGLWALAGKRADAELPKAGPALRATLQHQRGAAAWGEEDYAAACRAWQALADEHPTERPYLGSLAEALAKSGRYRDLLALARRWEGLGGTPEGRSKYNDVKRALEVIAGA